MRRFSHVVPIAVAVTLMAAAPSAGQERAGTFEPYPGGMVSALSETHGNWTLSCEANADGRSCLVTQTLGTKESRRRVLSVEVVGRPQGAASALLTLPFGLNLQRGVNLDLDDHAFASTVPFESCSEAGCAITLALSSDDVLRLKAGKVLLVRAWPADDEKPLRLSVSLLGFGSALDRTRQLLK